MIFKFLTTLLVNNMDVFQNHQLLPYETETLGVRIPQDFMSFIFGSLDEFQPVLIKLSYLTDNNEQQTRVFQINDTCSESEITYIPQEIFQEMRKPSKATVSTCFYHQIPRAHLAIIKPDREKFFEMTDWEEKLRKTLSQSQVINLGTRISIQEFYNYRDPNQDFPVDQVIKNEEKFTVVGIQKDETNETSSENESEEEQNKEPEYVDYAGILDIDLNIDFQPSIEAEQREKKVSERLQAENEQSQQQQGQTLGGKSMTRQEWLAKFEKK